MLAVSCAGGGGGSAGAGGWEVGAVGDGRRAAGGLASKLDCAAVAVRIGCFLFGLRAVWSWRWETKTNKPTPPKKPCPPTGELGGAFYDRTFDTTYGRNRYGIQGILLMQDGR